MQTEHAIEFDEVPSLDFSSHRPLLKVVLVYEDFEMGVQGKQVFDLMAKEAGGQSAARLTVWRFDFFHSAELTHAVARQAGEADAIIVAPRNLNSLPPQVKAWLEQWPAQRTLETGALVAVFHPSVGPRAKSSDAALLLWRAASRAQMDFICPTNGPAAGRPGTTTTESATARSRLAVTNPITITFNIQATNPHAGWGLND